MKPSQLSKSRRNKRGLLIVLACTVFGLVALYTLTRSQAAPEASGSTQTTTNQSTTSGSVSPDTPVSNTAPQNSHSTPGRYTDYSPANRESSNYTTTVLFFHAAWCPECRAYDNAIKNGQLPAGTQILKVDYDSSTDLRKQYGVTLQSTFVRVNQTGQLQKKWVGYGKTKSIDTILENVK